MAFDGESDAFDRQLDADDRDLDVSRTAHEGHNHAEDRECEEEYQRAVEALMERTCRLAREAESEPSRRVEATADDGVGSKPYANADAEIEAESVANRQDGQTETPLPHEPAEMTPRATSKEDAASLEVMREVANSSARQAVGLHAFQRLYASACQNMWLAAIAVGASFLFQRLDAGPATTGFMLVTWVAASYWAYQSFRATRQLAGRCAHDFDPKPS